MSARGRTLFEGSRQPHVFSPFRIALNRWNHRIAERHVAHHPQIAILSFDHIGLSVNAWGRYEHQLLSVLGDFLERLDADFDTKVALDVGANIGNHSLFLSEMFGEVHAFEPNPHAFELLRVNSTFSCPKHNVVCHNVGLSDREARLPLRVDPCNVGGGSILDSAESPDSRDRFIEVVRLDSVGELQAADVAFVKIDVEGHELRVLRGAEGLLARTRPIVLFEQHASEIVDGSSAVIEHLRGLGYRFATIEKNFAFGEGRIQKAVGLLLRIPFGLRLRIAEREHFRTQFYDMILAIPGENLERLA